MSFDQDFEFKNNKHFKTRATGQLYMGPIQAVGYDNKSLFKITINEMEFKNSEEAERFIEYQRKKYADTNKLCNQRNLKMISRYDD